MGIEVEDTRDKRLIDEETAKRVPPQEQESKSTPADMTPNPNFNPLHQGEELKPQKLLGALDRYGTTHGEKEEQPPPINKETLEGK